MTDQIRPQHRWLNIGWGILTLAVALLALWYVYSPARAVDALVDAARRDDIDEVARRVDLAGLHSSIVRQMVSRQVDAPPGTLARLGEDVAGLVARPVVEAAVTPQSVAEVVRRLDRADGAGGAKSEWSIEREGLDSFMVSIAEGEGRKRPVFRFRRDGVRWVLSEQHLLVGNTVSP